jgi:hypothetical protein
MDLLRWIEVEQLNINTLNCNENAIDYLNRYPSKIKLDYLVRNKNFNILPFIYENMDQLDEKTITIICSNTIHLGIEDIIRTINYTQKHWTSNICSNPLCIRLIEENPKHFIHNWAALSMNKNAYSLLIQNFQYINWDYISLNQSEEVLQFILHYPEKINWTILSMNPAAVPILKLHPSRIVYWALSSNYNAIDLIEQHLDRICWANLSRNKNAIHLLEKNQHLINWIYLSINPSIFYNYQQDSINRTNLLREDLVKKALHPSRIQYWLENGMTIDDL